MVRRGSLSNQDGRQQQQPQLAVRDAMMADLQLRLHTEDGTPIVVLQPRDIAQKNEDKTLDRLFAMKKVIVIMPDMTDNLVWQMLDGGTVRRYYYRPRAMLLGRPWAHWALAIDWSKKPELETEMMTPDREYTVEELEGKVKRTPSSRRRYRKKTLQLGLAKHSAGDGQGGSARDASARL